MPLLLEPPAASLASAEERLVAFFVRLAHTLGMPRSLGQIYGTLFCASAPLAFDELTHRSGVSKGAVSQGVRTLAGLRAIRSFTIPHDRRTFFQVESSMKRLVSNLLQESVEPFIEHSLEELKEIAATLAGHEGQADAEGAGIAALFSLFPGDAVHREPNRGDLAAKVDFLLHWHAEIRKLLPLLATLAAPPPS